MTVLKTTRLVPLLTLALAVFVRADEPTLREEGRAGDFPLMNGTHAAAIYYDGDDAEVVAVVEGSHPSVDLARLTSERGCGIVFADREDDSAMLRARIDYGDLRLVPGASAETEVLAVGCFDDVRHG